MIYKKLGNTDRKISVIGLGTMTFGEQTTRDEAFKIMDFAFENGINFFDTAEMYPVYPKKETQGMSEKIIGDWINSRNVRDKIVIGTKISSSHPKGIGATKLAWIRGGGNKLKFDSKNFNEALDSSLERLKTNYIDLYQLHWPERNVPIFGNFDYEHDENEKKWTPIEEILFTLNKYIKKKIIKNYGLSNETSWGLMKFLYEAKKNKIEPPASIQNPYNLINRVFDISLSEISLRENCGLLAYSPLAGGRLSGKYLKKNKSQNTRFALWPGRFDRHFTKKGELAIEKYINLSHKYKINPILLAHSFVLSRPFLTSSIMGVSDLDQLKQNIKSIDFLIENNILKKINEIHEEDRNPCV
tara:strand:- start:571 stop:1641 length:1071 start_codon:yes stop_codon:yes gene_type:complete